MNTKPIIHVGIALILLGIVAFSYQGGGDTGREKTLNFGPVQVAIRFSPVLGGAVLLGGIVLVIAGAKKSS